MTPLWTSQREYYTAALQRIISTYNGMGKAYIKKGDNPEADGAAPLISYGFTDKEIALCLSLSKEAEKQKINELMEKSQTANKAELRAFARKLYDTSFRADGE